jgi:hypothetical protein
MELQPKGASSLRTISTSMAAKATIVVAKARNNVVSPNIFEILFVHFLCHDAEDRNNTTEVREEQSNNMS